MRFLNIVTGVTFCQAVGLWLYLTLMFSYVLYKRSILLLARIFWDSPDTLQKASRILRMAFDLASNVFYYFVNVLAPISVTNFHFLKILSPSFLPI